MKRNRVVGIVVVAFLLIALPASFFYFFSSKVPPPPPAPHKFGPAPAFMLKHQDGGTLSNDDLKGYIYVADFFFTHCNSVCPKLSQLMNKMQESYKTEPRMRFVSFTIDPLRDSVPVLKAYANQYGALSDKWYFLTGDAHYIRDTIAEKGFKVPVVPDGGTSDQFTHTDRFVLVDGAGQIRGYFNVMDPPQTDSLYNMIERLLVEKR